MCRGLWLTLYLQDEKIIDIEGDPDSPISRGRLCPKGAATFQVVTGSTQMVEEICGCWQELFLKVAETLCVNSGRKRTTAFCYVVGWTQYSVGVQYICTASIIQLLLGNIVAQAAGF